MCGAATPPSMAVSWTPKAPGQCIAMESRSPATESDRSALIAPASTALIVVDEYARTGVPEVQGPWWRGRPYEQILDLSTLFDVPYIAYLTLGGCGSADETGKQVHSDAAIVGSHINPWREPAFVQAVDAVRRSHLLVSGYCAQGGITFAVLDALVRGFDVGYVADATIGPSCLETSLAIQRMTQAGAVPLSWRQLALEWQADWADGSTRERVIQLVSPLKRLAPARPLGPVAGLS